MLIPGISMRKLVVVVAMALFVALLIGVPSMRAYPMFQHDAQRTGNVSGVAPETATLLWESSEKTAGCIEAGPIVSEGRVYISTWWSWMGGNATDALYCLDEDTGEDIWNNTEVYGASTAAIADGKLFVGTKSGNITCVNTSDGEILWSKKIEDKPGYYGVLSSPLVYDDKVYVLSFSDGTLHAFSFDGTELWNFSTGGEIFYYSSPSAYDDKIFFAGNSSGQHALYCIDLSTDEELWNFTTETKIRGSPTIWDEEGLVFFTTKYVYGKEHKLYAVNITTGEEVWNVTHYSSWASPALSNGKLYIGGSGADTTFYCYDGKDGSLIWKTPVTGKVDSSPVVVDGKVYFGTNEVNGTIYALDANNGSTIWNYTLHIPPGYEGGYNVASHPAVKDRTLFIGADNVGVLAFKDRIFWEGNVTLTRNTTFDVTAHNSGKTYEINRTTALGALDAAAEKGRFNYTVSDEWYEEYGLLVDSIAGKESAGMKGWSYQVDETTPRRVNEYELDDGDVVTYYYGGMGTTPENSSMVLKIHANVTSPMLIFDTGMPENPYPSISGVHYGNITPSHDVYATKLFTRACEGTGGHPEYMKIWNDTWNTTATWYGYKRDWHNVSFDEQFVLRAGETYHYKMKTGSYPKIHHKSELKVSDGVITCTNFTDANGIVHNDWIPAITIY